MKLSSTRSLEDSFIADLKMNYVVLPLRTDLIELFTSQGQLHEEVLKQTRQKQLKLQVLAEISGYRLKRHSRKKISFIIEISEKLPKVVSPELVVITTKCRLNCSI